MDPNAGQASVVDTKGLQAASATLLGGAVLWKIVVSQLQAAADTLLMAAGAQTISSATSAGFSWSANGNVFDRSGIQAFAKGGVVNKPTVFQHTGGMGVMGEAGAEAILPLQRINGRLGVASTGSGGETTVSVEVNVDNRGNASSTSDSSGAKGEALGRLVAGVVKMTLVEGMRPGGLLSGA
jgi:phage-related minor tail protein